MSFEGLVPWKLVRVQRARRWGRAIGYGDFDEESIGAADECKRL